MTEDEFHFLFVCNIYDRIRNLYLRKFYYIRPSMHKMVLLFQRKSPKIVFDLAKYIKYALETRNNYINNLKSKRQWHCSGDRMENPAK